MPIDRQKNSQSAHEANELEMMAKYLTFQSPTTGKYILRLSVG